MKRELLGMQISQKSKSEFFSLTDLTKAGNKWRAITELSPFDVQGYFKQKSTKDLVADLESKYGKVKISARGRGQHTWVHPFLFVDVALSISPKLKIETYEWLFDSLLTNRNDSGDSYKKMSGAIWGIHPNKSTFPKTISNVAKIIQLECKCLDWQKATKEQLELRNRIQENIFLLSDFINNVDKCVEVAITKASAICKLKGGEDDDE
jgi:hypothetical protein